MLPRTRSGAYAAETQHYSSKPLHGAFFVERGEGWIGSSFSRSNGEAIAKQRLSQLVNLTFQPPLCICDGVCFISGDPNIRRNAIRVDWIARQPHRARGRPEQLMPP